MPPPSLGAPPRCRPLESPRPGSSHDDEADPERRKLRLTSHDDATDSVARLVGIEGGVVSGVFNLESSGVEAPDWRPRHDEHYHEA